MIKFDMNINEKFASFNEDRMVVFVQQIEKNKFSINAGKVPAIVYIGDINVENSFQLNEQLNKLFNKI